MLEDLVSCECLLKTALFPTVSELLVIPPEKVETTNNYHIKVPGEKKQMNQDKSNFGCHVSYTNYLELENSLTKNNVEESREVSCWEKKGQEFWDILTMDRKRDLVWGVKKLTGKEYRHCCLMKFIKQTSRH